MPDHDKAMLAYTHLADLSQQKKQLPGRDKLLILAGAAACRAGWPDIAQRCRSLVLGNNPAHLIGKTATFADALRNQDFASFLKQLERFCTYERAEHLLRELGIDIAGPGDDTSTSCGQQASEMLSADHWPEAGSS